VIESRRRAYLEALGFEVWIARPPPPERGRLVLSPDPAPILLVCGEPEHTATRFAGDLVRALGGRASWAWPDTVGGTDSVALADAIADRLVTQIVVFGSGPAHWLFGEEVPEIVGSATVGIAPDLGELAGSGPAKQSLWGLLRGLPDRPVPQRPS
jgi:hypothetical protein